MCLQMPPVLHGVERASKLRLPPHPTYLRTQTAGAAGVYMTGALVHSAAAHLSSLLPLSATRAATPAGPPTGPEVPAPSLLQQQLQQQGPVPGLLQPQQHW